MCGSINFGQMMVISAFLRLALIAYGEWQDAHMEVRYTDTDYFVFSDAAALVASGKSPFERSTYRYSPLLAFLLIPNSILHQSWGKLLFSSAGKGKKKNTFFSVFFEIMYLNAYDLHGVCRIPFLLTTSLLIQLAISRF